MSEANTANTYENLNVKKLILILHVRVLETVTLLSFPYLESDFSDTRKFGYLRPVFSIGDGIKRTFGVYLYIEYGVKHNNSTQHSNIYQPLSSQQIEEFVLSFPMHTANKIIVGLKAT